MEGGGTWTDGQERAPIMEEGQGIVGSDCHFTPHTSAYQGDKKL